MPFANAVLARPITYGSGSPKPESAPVSGLTKPIVIVDAASNATGPRGVAHAGAAAPPASTTPPTAAPLRLRKSARFRRPKSCVVFSDIKSPLPLGDAPPQAPGRASSTAWRPKSRHRQKRNLYQTSLYLGVFLADRSRAGSFALLYRDSRQEDRSLSPPRRRRRAVERSRLATAATGNRRARAGARGPRWYRGGARARAERQPPGGPRGRAAARACEPAARRTRPR